MLTQKVYNKGAELSSYILCGKIFKSFMMKSVKGVTVDG